MPGNRAAVEQFRKDLVAWVERLHELLGAVLDPACLARIRALENAHLARMLRRANPLDDADLPEAEISMVCAKLEHHPSKLLALWIHVTFRQLWALSDHRVILLDKSDALPAWGGQVGDTEKNRINPYKSYIWRISTPA